MRCCYIGTKGAICYNIKVLKAEFFRTPGEKCEVFLSCLVVLAQGWSIFGNAIRDKSPFCISLHYGYRTGKTLKR